MGKSEIINHPLFPIFPDGLWTDILLGRFIDLDKVYSGYYLLDTDYRSSQTIREFNISFANGINSSKLSKMIKTNGDCGIAFRRVKQVILFAYPHHSEELDEYEEYIVGQFAGTDLSLHLRILNFDQAIRVCES